MKGASTPFDFAYSIISALSDNKNVVFIEIDPSKRLADIDQKNNVLNVSK